MVFEKEYEDSLKEKAFISAEKNIKYDNENHDIMNPLKQIFELLENFDWSYEKSDSHNVWINGGRSVTKIKKAIADHLANNLEDKEIIIQEAERLQRLHYKSCVFNVNRFF